MLFRPVGCYEVVGVGDPVPTYLTSCVEVTSSGHPPENRQYPFRNHHMNPFQRRNICWLNNWKNQYFKQ